MSLHNYLMFELPRVPEDNDWHQVYVFPNNYGASILRDTGSYGYEEGLFELAVLYVKADPRPEEIKLTDLDLTYETQIADDVVGRIELMQAMAMLAQIAELPPYHGGKPTKQPDKKDHLPKHIRPRKGSGAAPIPDTNKHRAGNHLQHLGSARSHDTNKLAHLSKTTRAERDTNKLAHLQRTYRPPLAKKDTRIDMNLYTDKERNQAKHLDDAKEE